MKAAPASTAHSWEHSGPALRLSASSQAWVNFWDTVCGSFPDTSVTRLENIGRSPSSDTASICLRYLQWPSPAIGPLLPASSSPNASAEPFENQQSNPCFHTRPVH